MRAQRAIALWSTVAIAALTLHGGRARGESDDSFKVVVYPDTRASDIDRDLLRDVFLKKATDWNDHAAHPIQLSTKFAVAERFDHDVLRKTPAQLKSYWNQQIFSGKGTPPPEASSVGEVLEYVMANPGAIGYIPANVDPGRAKVIRVR